MMRVLEKACAREARAPDNGGRPYDSDPKAELRLKSAAQVTHDSTSFALCREMKNHLANPTEMQEIRNHFVLGHQVLGGLCSETQCL